MRDARQINRELTLTARQVSLSPLLCTRIAKAAKGQILAFARTGTRIRRQSLGVSSFTETKKAESRPWDLIRIMPAKESEL